MVRDISGPWWLTCTGHWRWVYCFRMKVLLSTASLLSTAGSSCTRGPARRPGASWGSCTSACPWPSSSSRRAASPPTARELSLIITLSCDNIFHTTLVTRSRLVLIIYLSLLLLLLAGSPSWSWCPSICTRGAPSSSAARRTSGRSSGPSPGTSSSDRECCFGSLQKHVLLRHDKLVNSSLSGFVRSSSIDVDVLSSPSCSLHSIKLCMTIFQFTSLICSMWCTNEMLIRLTFRQFVNIGSCASVFFPRLLLQ